MLKKIRWGIIGCGAVTEIKSGPAFNAVPNSELVAVMRRDARLAEDYARRHKVAKWYSTAQDLINDPEVDAVYIATPPNSHKEYALQCAAAGKPCYVEKPMALNFAECNEMIVACRDTATPLFVAYYRRSLPRFKAIFDLVNRQGAIGTPRVVNIRLYRQHAERYHNPAQLPWTVQPSISGGGIFVDLACHTLDILDFILGPIESVRGHASSQLKAYPAEDSVSATFMFASGVHGVGLWNFASFCNEDEVEIVGDAGKVSFATFGNSPVLLETAAGVQSLDLPNPSCIQHDMIASVVAELLGRGECPSTGSSAARTSLVMDQILQSYYE